MNTQPRSCLALALALLLSGCASLGGNVRGDFACRAPKGDCAPLTAIDAGAVAQLTGNSSAAQRAEPAVTATPTGAALSSVPQRSGERTLTIFVPAHVDLDGVLHDAATLHAVVEAPRWLTPSLSPRGLAPSPRGDVVGIPLPTTEESGSLPGGTPPLLHGVDDVSPLPPALLPSSEALAAARAGHRIGEATTLTTAKRKAVR